MNYYIVGVFRECYGIVELVEVVANTPIEAQCKVLESFGWVVNRNNIGYEFKGISDAVSEPYLIADLTKQICVDCGVNCQGICKEE